MTEAIWKPSQEYIKKSALYNYQKYINNNYGIKSVTYNDLHSWSVENLEIFWESILQYFDISYSGSYAKVLQWNQNNDDFIGVKWFEGIYLNYAEHIFKNSTTERPALKFSNENQEYSEISWQDLEDKVSIIQQYLIEKGIHKGDRVTGILNNTVDTIAIFLACNALGAIWSCCSPDFGDSSIYERFTQIEPKILFIHTSYQYNNKVFTKKETAVKLKESIPSILECVDLNAREWENIFIKYQPKKVTFERVPFSHPIWILYSSGTTGKPKAITHSTGGNLLEHFKALALHQNVQKGDNFLWYSTTGWMMWNYAISSLLCGSTLSLFDGVIIHKRHYTFWNFLRKAKVDHLGAGAIYFSSLKNFSIKDYSPKVIGSTGSPLPDSTFEDLHKKFPSTPIISLSGGTDVCSAFLSGCSFLPVFPGQLQCRTLGSDIQAYNDEHKPVYDEVGELVIVKPMPSMPIYFWNDKDDIKYKESYFDKYSGVWNHGDWIKITSDEGIIIYGRSDATLNRGGVRIGTAEIYHAVNELDQIQDSIVITMDNSDGSSKMILFVKIAEDSKLSAELLNKIKHSLRENYSPRHVPDYIVEVSDIPYTLSGKKMEIPIKKIFSGAPISKAVSIDTMRNPEVMEEYVELYTSLKKEG